MVHYFYGADTWAARAALRELARAKGAAVRWFDEPGAGIAAALGRGSRGLFGSEIVVARDAGAWPAHLQRELVAVLAGTGAASEVVVWDRGPADRRSLLFKQLKQQAKQGGSVREFQPLSPPAAAAWVVEEAGRQGGAATAPAARLLVERLGVDRWRLSAEVAKLLLAGGTIDEQTVRENVAEPVAAEIFGMLEALSRGQRQRAVASVQALLDRGESEFYILSMLAYQFRTLYAIRRGIEQGLRPGQIATAVGLKPFAVQKNYSAARRFDSAYLRETLARILACDFAIRRGRVDQRTALMMLVLTLASGAGG
jgi:DNA polymerase-3 subunit delta